MLPFSRNRTYGPGTDKHDHLSPAQAADQLGVSEALVHQWIASGDLPTTEGRIARRDVDAIAIEPGGRVLAVCVGVEEATPPVE